ncbi:hypothetical protein SAMN02927930_01970, partial [Pseudidiomarina indica]
CAMGKIKLFLLLLGVLGLVTGCGSSKESLQLHEATVMLKEPGLQNLDNPDKQIAILPTGTKVVILSKEYGKDYLAYEVETSDGLKGYIIHSNKMTLTNPD